MDYRMTEKLEPCPYNSSHQILPHRMAKHITKCKKNYPDADMKVCPFNAVHVVPTHKYSAHLLECENRDLVERGLYSFPKEDRAPSTVSEAVPQDNNTPPAAKIEDWETECVQSSYKPQDHVIYKEFTRPPPPGMSKGARKQWRLNEIERVRHLKNAEKKVGITGNDKISSMFYELNSVTQGKETSIPGLTLTPKPRDGMKVNLSELSTQDSAHNVDKTQEPKGSAMSDFMKEKRKIEMKLFEIKKLEDLKKNYNEKLTDKEETKISSKKMLENKLSNLMSFMHI